MRGDDLSEETAARRQLRRVGELVCRCGTVLDAPTLPRTRCPECDTRWTWSRGEWLRVPDAGG